MKRILIIDDAPTVRMYYRQVLENNSFSVAEASNGVEGLEKAFTESFDLLIVDVNMPVMDGYALLRAVRCEPTLCKIPAIMISTEADEKDANAAYSVGANYYLVKPVKPADLVLYARLLTGESGA
ncbi:putative chemotaxis regulator CheY [Gammaproteobacteria bacterium]